MSYLHICFYLEYVLIFFTHNSSSATHLNKSQLTWKYSPFPLLFVAASTLFLSASSSASFSFLRWWPVMRTLIAGHDDDDAISSLYLLPLPPPSSFLRWWPVMRTERGLSVGK